MYEDRISQAKNRVIEIAREKRRANEHWPNKFMFYLIAEDLQSLIYIQDGMHSCKRSKTF